ncbi:hypothetical protein [Vibrio phage RYC]|nr:hypothetical protein [Vibrio phage RYC]
MINTNKLVGAEEFTKSYKRVEWASHWVDEFGSIHKLNDTVKRVYAYRLERYKYFKSIHKDMYEANQTVSDTLGIGKSSVERAMQLLKAMGLADVCQIGHNKYITHIYPPEYIKGDLVNKKIDNKDKGGKAMTKEEWEVMEHNKRIKNKVLASEHKMHVLTEEEYIRLLELAQKGKTLD